MAVSEMSDKQRLLDLAARCEAATGPDRELDVAIALSLPGFFNAGPYYDGAKDRIGTIDVDGNKSIPGNDPLMLVRHYTASLDAAMSLVPEGQRRVEFGTYNGGGAWAYVHVGSERGEQLGESEADTETLALCAAALRAIAQTAGNEVGG